MSTTIKTESILKAMKGALVMAHNTNNARAISKDFCAGCGVPENVYESWVTWIKLLHEAVTPWVTKFNDKDVTDEELQEIYKAVFPILRQLKRVDDKLFLRESDAIRICGFAAKHGKTANGSVDVAMGAKAFRREIETMLGIRIAQSAVLTEDEYGVITKYESAENNLEKAQNKLNGVERNGKEVKGLIDKLAEATKTLNDMKALVNVPDDVKNDDLVAKYPVLAGYVKAVKDLESDKKNTEKRIKETEDYLKENKAKYGEVLAKVNKIK